MKALVEYFPEDTAIKVEELGAVIDAPLAFRRRVSHFKVVEASADNCVRLEWCVGQYLTWLDEVIVQFIAELPSAEMKQWSAPTNNGARLVSDGIAALFRL